MGEPATGVQPTGAQSIHLARSSIPVWLPDGLIPKLMETMGAPASAKISASRHRCCCHCCERAPIPHSNCLAFPDVQNCSVDLGSAVQSSAIQQRRSVPRSVPSSVPADRSAGTRCSSRCFRVSELHERFQSTCHPAGCRSRPGAALAAPSAEPQCYLVPRRSADSATGSWSLKEQPGVRWPRSSRGSESPAVCRSRNAHSGTARDSSAEDACGRCRTLCPRPSSRRGNAGHAAPGSRSKIACRHAAEQNHRGCIC